MLSREKLKEMVRDRIAAHREEITALGTRIENNPELGFKEKETAALLETKLQDLGLPFAGGLAHTGIRAQIETSGEGPNVAIMGEMDAVICFEHPLAHPETGAAHACGHHAQVAALYGAALGLNLPEVRRALSGRITLMAVPAEEYVEIEYRNTLRERGKLRYLGGKPELIARGAFDDIDMALMFHARTGDLAAGIASSSNGCLTKLIRYTGKAAHAGGSPHKGVNALYAAMLGLSGINAQRETFRDQDCIRIHPIITRGGDLVNIIPSDVRLETYVRGKNLEAIRAAASRVNQALKGGALALGAQVEIKDIPGYLPLRTDPNLRRIAEDNIRQLTEGRIADHGHNSASTDLGDISQLMPAIEIGIGGFSGSGHGADFRVSDPDLAYITSAQTLALSAIDLLYGDATPAAETLNSYEPRFRDTAEYMESMDQLFSTEQFGDLNE